MKFSYNLDTVVRALTYNDLKGLLVLVNSFLNNMDNSLIDTLAISDMEVVFKENFT